MFFANGGGALPSLEEKTRHAGANALKAASEFWQMVSELENSKDPIAKGICRENANIDPGLGFIWRISDTTCFDGLREAQHVSP